METTKSTSIDDLFQFFKAGIDRASLENIDYSTLRYALYARKSTIGDERQEHSIGDQIAYCTDICIKPHSLNVVKTVQEKGSAKEPDIRPLFSELVQDIKDGKIDGIICYHPDRLSRNMKEAGELIDLLDKSILKDLRFATSNFENSPTGKMLLGISFVLSKQYSENLSQNVTRGNVRATEERGQFLGKRVHGYYISKDRQLVTDGHNFVSIQEAFNKRLQGETLKDIANWLNKQSYTVRAHGKKAQPYKWDKARVSPLLKDPVYVGVLKYGKSLVKLQEFYDFTPALSVEDFLKINNISDLTSAKLMSSYQGTKSGAIRADLLRGLVSCGECTKLMSSGISSKKKLDGSKTEYYYYRCENDDCVRRGKSVRAKVVIYSAIEVLKQYLFTTKENYESYKQDAKESVKLKTTDLNSTVARLAKLSGDKKIEYDRAKQYKAKDPEGIGKHYDLDEIKEELDSLNDDLKLAKQKRDTIKDSIITYEKYLELFENIGSILEVGISKNMSMSALDGILRKFFSNFELEATGDSKLQWSVSSYKLNEPWQGFIESNNVRLGRGERT